MNTQYFYTACEKGDCKYFNRFLKFNSITSEKLEYVLENACQGGHMELVELMILKGAKNWDRGLEGACRGGDMKCVKLMIQKGTKNWDRGLQYAYAYGHFEIVNLMMQKGGNLDLENVISRKDTKGKKVW